MIQDKRFMFDQYWEETKAEETLKAQRFSILDVEIYLANSIQYIFKSLDRDALTIFLLDENPGIRKIAKEVIEEKQT